MLRAATDTFEKAMRRGFNEEVFRRARLLSTEAKNEAAAALGRQMQVEQAKVIMHSRSMPRWLIAIMLECAAKHDVSPDLVASKCHLRRVTRARNEAIYLAKCELPAMSVVRISKWFGMNHSSVHHAMARHAEVNGLPFLSGYSIKVRRKNNTEWHRKHRSALYRRTQEAGK